MLFQFLYNALNCMAYTVIAVGFGMLYRAELKRGYLWTALLFSIYILDILIVFMYDFVPEFSGMFDGLQREWPVVYAWINIGILLLYRLILGSLFQSRFPWPERVGWGLGLAGVTAGYGYEGLVGGSAFGNDFDRIVGGQVGLACTFALSIWIVAFGVLQIARSSEGLRGWKTRFASILVAVYAVCETATYIGQFQALQDGHSSPQEVSIEIMALAFTIAAIVYLLHRRRLQDEQLRETIVREVARDYELTKREDEILAALVQGLGNRAIAEQEYVSLSTVKNHISSIYRKLGVGSRGELVSFVEEAYQKRRRESL